MEKRKFLTLPGLELYPSIVQPIAIHYTDYTTQAPLIVLITYLNLDSRNMHAKPSETAPPFL
jgi:hypothetical protein